MASPTQTMLAIRAHSLTHPISILLTQSGVNAPAVDLCTGPLRGVGVQSSAYLRIPDNPEAEGRRLQVYLAGAPFPLVQRLSNRLQI